MPLYFINALFFKDASLALKFWFICSKVSKVTTPHCFQLKPPNLACRTFRRVCTSGLRSNFGWLNCTKARGYWDLPSCCGWKTYCESITYCKLLSSIKVCSQSKNLSKLALKVVRIYWNFWSLAYLLCRQIHDQINSLKQCCIDIVLYT